MDDRPLTLFALNASAEFGRSVSEHLGLPLSGHEERAFDDGEHKVRPLVDVRGGHVVVIHSLFGEAGQAGGPEGEGGGSPNDKLLRLLFFVGALRDAGAARVTAVVPYVCYARKDRRTKPRDPLTLRYVATICEAIGFDELITMDAHNQAAFENAFRCPAMHLEATPLFARHFAAVAKQEGDGPLAAVSPDVGGVKRAETFRRALAEAAGGRVGSAFMEKRRSDDVVTGDMLVGDVRGRVAILYDDLIATGTTLIRAARACMREGATAVYAAATHGLFVGGAGELFAEPSIRGVVVCNTVPPLRVGDAGAREHLTVLDAGPTFAEAIRRAAPSR